MKHFKIKALLVTGLFFLSFFVALSPSLEAISGATKPLGWFPWTQELVNSTFAGETKDRWEELKAQELELKKGAIGFAEIKDLRPTQIFYGKIEVQSRVEKLENMDKSDRRKYQLENPIPVVVGPRNDLYIVDHHHLARALSEIEKTKALVEIVSVQNKKSDNEFWTLMIKNNWAYPYGLDHETRLKPLELADALPRSVSRLKDDPYRSLAWAVRKEEGYKKCENIYFMEFQWADFFRSRIKIGRGEDGFDKAVEQAVELAKSKEASDLPGSRSRGCKK